MLDGVLDGLLQLLLDLVESTNVIPRNVGNLDDGLPESGGVGSSESEPEVVHGNTKGVQDLGIDSVSAIESGKVSLGCVYTLAYATDSLVQIDQVHLLSNLLHGGLGTESGHIGTDVSVSVGSDLLEVDIVTELHVLGVDTQDLETAGRVGNTNVDFTVESPESSQSGVNRVGLRYDKKKISLCALEHDRSARLTLLVAAMTTTFDRAFNPSIKVKSWETTRLSTSPLVCDHRDKPASDSFDPTSIVVPSDKNTPFHAWERSNRSRR